MPRNRIALTIQKINKPLSGMLVGLVLVLTVINLALCDAPTATAASTSGLTVSPASLNFKLQKSGDQQTIPVTLTNNSGASIDLAAEFMGIDDARGQFIPTGDIDSSLAGSLQLDRTELTVPANSARTIQVQFSDSSNLAPGGHYATLVITQQSSGGQLGLRAAASITIFATKLGGASPQVALRSTDFNGWLFSLPSAANLTFASTGNVLVVPRASIDVLSTDQLIAKGIANQESLPILPGRQRAVHADIVKIGSVWLPRTLKFTITYRADGIAQTQTAQIQRLYIPAFYPVVLLVAFGSFVWLRFSKRGKGTWTKIQKIILLLLKLPRQRVAINASVKPSRSSQRKTRITVADSTPGASAVTVKTTKRSSKL